MKRQGLQVSKVCGRILTFAGLVSVLGACGLRMDSDMVQVYDSSSVRIYAMPVPQQVSAAPAITRQPAAPLYLTVNGRQQAFYASGRPTTYMVKGPRDAGPYAPVLLHQAANRANIIPTVYAQSATGAYPLHASLPRYYNPGFGLPPEPILASHRRVGSHPVLSHNYMPVHKLRVQQEQEPPIKKTKQTLTELKHQPLEEFAPEQHAGSRKALKNEVFSFLIEEQDITPQEIFPSLIEEQDLTSLGG